MIDLAGPPGGEPWLQAPQTLPIPLQVPSAVTGHLTGPDHRSWADLLATPGFPPAAMFHPAGPPPGAATLPGSPFPPPVAEPAMAAGFTAPPLHHHHPAISPLPPFTWTPHGTALLLAAVAATAGLMFGVCTEAPAGTIDLTVATPAPSPAPPSPAPPSPLSASVPGAGAPGTATG
jgi:hypothetical protein